MRVLRAGALSQLCPSPENCSHYRGWTRCQCNGDAGMDLAQGAKPGPGGTRRMFTIFSLPSLDHANFEGRLPFPLSPFPEETINPSREHLMNGLPHVGTLGLQ